jgi:hypothetical protein
MTVRYSHLSPDFLQDAVDKLAPQQPDEQSNQTDTSALESAEPPTDSVH